MQNQQQVGGGGPQSVSGYGGGVAAEMVISDENQKLGDLGIAEAASPISSRPPAQAGIGNANFEEMIQATAEAGGSSGNRWPRQETLALLQIRSEMDPAFRDATLKGPLWEQVSRKLGELGYKRSAKKCKEKFENVHKYYKRTKEGRGGRQDGKSYKFFTQLEALNHSIATAAQLLPRIANPTAAAPPPLPQPAAAAVVSLPPPAVAVAGTSTREGSAVPLFGVSFSSDSSSSEDDDEEEDEEMELGDDRNQRKRKRSHGGEDQSEERMMDFFEGLLKQVMQKQEAMQRKFLEAIEKREQDRMIREEAWKRQDMARVAHENDLMAQERAISASRDAAIVAFLEKITGQTIHLPTAVPQNPPPPTAATTPPPPPPPPSEHYRPQPTHDQPQSMEIVAVVPEQQIIQHDLAAAAGVGGSGGSFEMSSSRWPKAEVLALIHLRSGMEAKYLEAGPKGPLWEEISAGMQRMGYSRSAKRCKEKWENINKYFKKVKESNKKRPEDAKTCPYFHELDALYRKKIIGSTSSGGGAGGGERKLQHQQDVVTQSSVSMEKLDGGRSEAQTSGVGAMSLAASFGSQTQGNVGGENQPEDMLKKQVEENHGHMIEKCSNNINDCSNSDDEDMNYEEDEEYDEEEMKMVYKVQQFQTRPNNGGGTPPSSFVAMVQ